MRRFLHLTLPILPSLKFPCLLGNWKPSCKRWPQLPLRKSRSSSAPIRAFCCRSSRICDSYRWDCS